MYDVTVSLNKEAWRAFPFGIAEKITVGEASPAHKCTLKQYEPISIDALANTLCKAVCFISLFCECHSCQQKIDLSNHGRVRRWDRKQ